MLRDKSLIPLSHQHQHVLALCVRMDRASPIGTADLAAWQTELTQLVNTEISIHFAAEEKVVFPAARKFGELHPLVEELLADHGALREYFARAKAGQLSAADLPAFARRMSAHIRKEERQLFEGMQGSMTQEDLALLGRNLEDALKEAVQVCSVPMEATKLRPTK